MFFDGLGARIFFGIWVHALFQGFGNTGGGGDEQVAVP